MFAAIGDCLTQRCGRINLGLEGIVAAAAAAAVAAATATGSPWLGLLAAILVGLALAFLHWACCTLPKIDDLAAGIALLVFGVGLARYTGSDLGPGLPPQLPVITFTAGLPFPLDINLLLPIGLVGALLISFVLARTGAGLLFSITGSCPQAVRLQGFSPDLIRLGGTLAGGLGGGIAGACLALHYPGGWSDNLASGVGISAVALVFLTRSDPSRATLAAFLFAAAATLGPVLQTVAGTGGYHILNTLPQLGTIILLAMTKHHLTKSSPYDTGS